MSKSKAKRAPRKSPPASVLPGPSGMRRLQPIFITALFLAGIFLLPYHIPGPGPLNSQSWEFGFNNTVSQGLIALMLLFLFAWRLFFGVPVREEDMVATTLVSPPEPFSPRPLLFTMGILQMFAFVVLLGWYTLLPMSHYGEFTYFIQRVEAAVLGGAPYTDFSFDYGPALLALPVDIYRLFHASISVEASYAAALIIHFVLGFGLLAYIISQVNTRGRVLLLGMIGFQWINLTMGIQYTPVRFSISLASLFAVRQIHRVTEGSPSLRLALLAVAGFILPLLNFSISSEMGLAITISLCVYFLWFVFGPERRLALLALPVVAGVGLAGFFFPLPYFAAMLSFGKGGGNFPIFPTIHILGFLAAAILVFPRLGLIAVRDRSSAGPFCAGLAFLLGLFILPATGRCDPGHIWINSLGLIIIALASVSWLEKKWWYAIWGVYAGIFPLTSDISFWDHYEAPIENALSIRSQLSGVSFDADNFAHLAPGAPQPPIHYSKLLPDSGLASAFPPDIKIGLILGDNESLERFLILNHRNIPTYYIPPFSDINNEEDIQHEYRELQSMPYLFLPSYYLNFLRPVDPALQLQAQGAADCKFMSGLLLFPINLAPVHPLFQPEIEIMQRVARDYTVVKQYQSGVLLKRRDAPAAQ